MWHEQRAEERKMRGMLVDRRKRAERRREHYEKMATDPNQFMQVHGRSYKVHLDPSISMAADSPANMMPWAGDNKILIDRFDARANLEMIPEYSKGTKENDSEGKDEAKETRAVNYERYRILVQNEYLSVGEEKFLKTIELEEKFGGKTYQQNKSKEEKKKSSNKAAIGFVYRDSAPVDSGGSEDSAGSDSEDSDDVDLDLSVDVLSLGTNQQTEINQLGVDYQMGKKDFVRFFARDVEEVEEMKMEREEEKDKSQMSGRKSRRQRRLLKERRAYENKFRQSPPSYAVNSGTKSPRRRSLSRSSDSESDVGEGKVEFITCFGGGDSDPEVKKEVNKKKKNPKKGEYDKPIGPSLPSHRSRSRSRHRHRSRSRGRKSRSRDRKSKSRSRDRKSKSRSRDRKSKSRSRDRKRRRHSRRSRTRSKSKSLPITSSKSRSLPRTRSKSRSLPRKNTWNKKEKVKAFTPPPPPLISQDPGIYASLNKNVDKVKSSSDSSDSSEDDGNPTRYRSKYRNKRANSSDDSDDDNKNDNGNNHLVQNFKDNTTGPTASLYNKSMSSFFSTRTKDKKEDLPKPPPVHHALPVPEPPPMRRYYGRRKENESDSELSVDSDSEKIDSRPNEVENNVNDNGGNGLSTTKEEKTFSIKDKLKKKMLQQIRKTFKEDKKAELERQKKAEEEQLFREEELREMSDKLRAQAKERRRLAGESESDEDLSPLTSIWRSERDEERTREDKERKRNTSPGIKRLKDGSEERKRNGSGESKRNGSGERKKYESGEVQRNRSEEREIVKKRNRSGERESHRSRRSRSHDRRSNSRSRRKSSSRERKHRHRSRERDSKVTIVASPKLIGPKLVDY